MVRESSISERIFAQSRGAFHQRIASVNDTMDRWLAGPRSQAPDMDVFDDPIYLKNKEMVVTYGNKTYFDIFGGGKITIGLKGAKFLNGDLANDSVCSDTLLLGGATSMTMEHLGMSADGTVHYLQTYKRLISDSCASFQILGLSRVIGQVEELEQKSDSIQWQYQVYSSFEWRDKSICLEYANGKSTNQIAKQLGVSRKTIENLRKRILCELKFEKPVEIVKLVARLQDRKLIG